MSGQEIFVIIIVVLLLFGADKLPEIARSVSKGMRDFRKATDDIRREFEESTSEIRKDLSEVTTSLTNDATDISHSIKKDADEVADNIQKDITDFRDTINNDVTEVKNNLESEAHQNVSESQSVIGDTHAAQVEPEQKPEADTETHREVTSTYKRTINEPDENYYNYRD